MLSGETAIINNTEKVLKDRGMTCMALSVAAAFHSELIADASKPFLEALKNKKLTAGDIPVYANSTAKPYPKTDKAAKELLSKQLARPVEFVEQIKRMADDGVTTFIEIGPGARLTGLVKAILKDQAVDAIALDASNGKRNGLFDLAALLAKLSALGLPIEIIKWDAGAQTVEEFDALPKPKFTVDLCGANYMKPKPKRPPIMSTAPRTNAQPAIEYHKPTPTPVTPQPQAPATPPPAPTAPRQAADPALSQALQLTQQNMTALKNIQEQTAELHRRFLESQQAAVQSFQALIEQQKHLMTGSAPAAPAQPAPAPQPSKNRADLAATGRGRSRNSGTRTTARRNTNTRASRRHAAAGRRQSAAADRYKS